MKDFDDLAYWDQVAIDRGAAVATIETALRTSPPDGDYLAVVGDIEIHFSVPDNDFDLGGETLPEAIWGDLTQRARDHL